MLNNGKRFNKTLRHGLRLTKMENAFIFSCGMTYLKIAGRNAKMLRYGHGVKLGPPNVFLLKRILFSNNKNLSNYYEMNLISLNKLAEALLRLNTLFKT